MKRKKNPAYGDRLGPQDILEPGTRVSVPAGVGTVVKHEIAHNGVVVHTVKVTEKFVRTFGSRGKYVPIKKTWRGNYSFVRVLRNENPTRRAARREFIERGAKLYEDFSGHRAKVVGRTKKPKIPDVLVNVGVVDFIGYTTVRDGKREEYIHKFKRSAKPLFCVTPNGDHIFLLEGRYDFTEAGIVDRS